MIDFLITNDVNSGVLKIGNKSTSLSGITKGIIRVVKLGFEVSLESGSSPTLADFLNPSLSVLIPISSKVDEVLDVEYILLKPITGSSYTSGSNTISKVGIFAETQDVKHLYSNGKLFTIDKNASSQNQLYTTETFNGSSTDMYKAYYVKECVVSLYDIPKLIKTLTLSQADCACKTCGGTIDKITSAHRYVEALQSSVEADCDARVAFMKCLKDLFNLC